MNSSQNSENMPPLKLESNLSIIKEESVVIQEQNNENLNEKGSQVKGSGILNEESSSTSSSSSSSEDEKKVKKLPTEELERITDIPILLKKNKTTISSRKESPKKSNKTVKREKLSYDRKKIKE